ncbi:hypothetical protein [Streptomyces sp. S-2]|uniref:hypothetical protein n=1 Tax=Streptomyces sp. S-2 TaxID=2675217 RepID=UPI001436B578|nr:hypothetical protein [Streptomyces sp. S-2]MBV7255064.1 hypothetical protein [Streptomyces sp. S-2]
MRWQTDRNRAELGCDPELAFVHNPERQQADLATRLRAAFAVLEERVHAGHLSSYGVATWSSFQEKAFTVQQLDRLAAEAAGGDHHLRAIQLPVSLVMDQHAAEALRGTGPIAAAAELGWDVHASAPLHGGELPRLATPEIAELIRSGATVAAACLTAVASCPGVSKVLLATGNPAHWIDALAATRAEVPRDTLRSTAECRACQREPCRARRRPAVGRSGHVRQPRHDATLLGGGPYLTQADTVSGGARDDGVPNYVLTRGAW